MTDDNKEEPTLMISKYINEYLNERCVEQKMLKLQIIRRYILKYGCPNDDINITSDKVTILRKNEDTIRGKLWRIALGVGVISSHDYIKQIKNGENRKNYVNISSVSCI